MKIFFQLSGILMIAMISSCSSYQSGNTRESDDRYYSLRDAKSEQRAARKLNAAQPSSFADDGSTINNNNAFSPNVDSNYQRIPDSDNYTPNSNGTVVNNYYEESYDLDNYYDYMYASRIRRFHRNTGNFGYYDPFFTNSYFYNNNPMMFGNSIYSSYGFFNPYVPWGFNNWGGGPGLNIGWNSFNGFHMNFNSGWNNPYSMFNNPWRWNTWGYNPWSSPFSYNPWGYSPWGFGMNSWNNGMYGYSNALMYNSMMYNPVYYNSYDNNTYNNTNIVNNYGPNYNGAGGGSSYKTDQSISNLLSKEIGQSVSSVHAADVKSNANSNSVAPGKNNSTNGVIQSTAVKGVKQSDAAVKGQTSVSGTEVKSGKQAGAEISPSTQNPKDKTQPATSIGSTPVKDQGTSVQTGVKGGQVVPEKYTGVKADNQSPVQTGKQELIQQGTVQPSKGETKQPAVNNYNSAPVKGTQAAPDNSPAINRPANIDPSRYDSPKTQSGVPTQNSVRPNSDPKPQPYAPNYDYSNGVKGSGNNEIRGNSQAPSNNLPKQQNQQYQVPRQQNQVPAQNYQQYQAPNTAAPKQPNQAPTQNYQQYRAPNNSAPKQQYQAPSRQYDTPRQQEQPRQYSAPRQKNSEPRQQYQAPRQNTPREQYQAPRQSTRPSNSTPSPRMSAPSSPRMSSPSSPRMSSPSSPRMSSPSSPSRGSSNSGSSGSGGGRVSSPRR